MSGWRTVEAALRDHRVRDVLVPGWIDRDDDLPEFRPQPMAVWLRLDEGLLRFESQGQYDRLGASRVPGVHWADIELLAEAEDEVIVASFGEQLFGDGRDALRCTRLRAYRTSAGADCTCLALDLEGAARCSSIRRGRSASRWATRRTSSAGWSCTAAWPVALPVSIRVCCTTGSPTPPTARDPTSVPPYLGPNLGPRAQVIRSARPYAHATPEVQQRGGQAGRVSGGGEDREQWRRLEKR